MEEVWKDIESCDGYQASNLGNIRSKQRRVWIERKNAASGWKNLKEKLIKPATDRRGYLFFMANSEGRQKTTFVHRAVLFAFVGFRSPDVVVNHKDGQKTNNKLENLEFVTQQQNVDHAIATGLMNNSGEHHGLATATEPQVRKAHSLLALGVRTNDVAKQTGLTKAQVLHVMSGKRWQHLGLGPVVCLWRKTVTDEHRRAVLEMNGSGAAIDTIAHHVGLGISTVRRIVKSQYALAP